MQRTLRRLLLLALCLGWMGLIFAFSAQTGETSGRLSAMFSRPLTDALARLRRLAPWQAEEFFWQVDAVFRKMAHIAEYAVLGAALAVTLRCFRMTHPMIPIALGALYAASDELHQFFSPDRAARWTDVLLDTAGVCIGVGAVCLIHDLWRKRHVHHS